MIAGQPGPMKTTHQVFLPTSGEVLLQETTRQPTAATKEMRVTGKPSGLPGRIENLLNCGSHWTGLVTPALYSALTRVYAIS